MVILHTLLHTPKIVEAENPLSSIVLEPMHRIRTPEGVPKENRVSNRVLDFFYAELQRVRTRKGASVVKQFGELLNSEQSKATERGAAGRQTCVARMQNP